MVGLGICIVQVRTAHSKKFLQRGIHRTKVSICIVRVRSLTQNNSCRFLTASSSCRKLLPCKKEPASSHTKPTLYTNSVHLRLKTTRDEINCVQEMSIFKKDSKSFVTVVGSCGSKIMSNTTANGVVWGF